MTYHFDAEALEEYADATRHYAQVRLGLAEEFVREVERAITTWWGHSPRNGAPVPAWYGCGGNLHVRYRG